jgi:hydrogenase/urease accessory protein HupE
MTKRFSSLFLSIIALTALSAPAMAHPGGVMHDIVDGLAHPLTVAVALFLVVSGALIFRRKRAAVKRRR